MEGVILIFAAVLIDRLLGEAPSRLHPVCAMGLWADWCEDRVRRSFGGTLGAGTLAAVLVLAPWTGLAFGLTVLAGLWAGLWAACAVSAVVVYVCLAPRSLAEHAQAVAVPLGQGDLPAARKAVSFMVGRDVSVLDAHGVGRACVESVGENLVDGVLATLFWAAVGYLVLGSAGAAGGAVLHRACNTLDAMWGKRNERYARFGTFAARLDDCLAWCPARLSLPVIALSAGLLRLSGLADLRAWDALCVGFRHRGRHASPNSAWSEAAFAGALGLRLGGPATYGGVTRPHPFLGEGIAEATAAHIADAVRLMWATTGLFALFVSVPLL